ncbi:phage tail tape measure protein [Leptotrichia wadei]|uniref:Phage tail tape measure protein, TP901 family n=1 Tax=Leptotrichia wadei TaxID=157687 RepID=A0A510KEQ7_9FUSO|nr:phage tail tape measure protein [Leptotrichia wadei]BBM49697.1 phage tail tape measure protein, TP901 family [Leptotrichia wadei]
MAKNLELNIVLGAAVASAISGMSQVANALKNTTKSVKEFEKEIKSMEKAQKAFQNMDKARDGLNKINSEYKKAAEHLQKLKAEYERTGSSNKQLAKEIEQAEKNVGKLNKQKERQQHVFEAARSKIEAEGASLSNYRNKVQEVEKEIEKMNKLKEAQKRYDARQESIGRMKDFGDKQITQGMGIAGALAVPVKIALDTRESQADLKKMVDGAEKYYGKLRDISERSSLSQAKVFEMAGALAQSGIQEKDLVEYTEQANKIAVAFDIDAAAAGNFLAKTKEQLGLGKEELFAYSNAINHMSDHSASRAAELTEISGRVGGIAKGAGVSNSALLGLSATLVSFNKTPEQAATGLKNFFGALTKGSATSKKATNAFKSIGLDVNKLAVDMQRDGEGTILRVLQKIKEANPAEQGALISTIFGEEAKSSVQDMVNNLDKVKKNLKEAKVGFGKDAVDTEYNKRMDTPLNKMLMAKNKVVNSMGDLGNALMPTITGALEKLSPLIDKVSQFIQKNPQLAAGIMKSVAGFAAFKIGLGGLAKVFAPVFSGISKGISIFDKFKAAGSFAEGFKTAFPTISKIGSGLKKLGQSGLKIGKTLGSGLVKGIKVTGKVAKIAGSGIVKGAKFVGSGAMNGAKVIGSGAKAVGGMAVQGAAKGMQLLTTGAQKAIGAIRAVGIALKVAFMANPVGFIIAAIVAVVVILVVLYNKCSWFRNMVNAVFKALGSAIKAVWNGIKAAAMAVWNAIVSFIRSRVEAQKAQMRTIVNVARSVWNAIKAAAVAVWNAIKSAATALWNGLKSGITAVGSFFKTTWEGIKGAAIAVWNGIKSAFDAVVGGLKSAISGVVKFFTDKWNGLKNMVSKGLGAVGNFLGFGKNAAGTNYWSGGLTTVAERGAELIQMPGKPAFLAEHEMLLNLPRGTQILNNRETKNSFRDKISGLKERMSGLRSNEGSSGGDVINISITVNGNADTSAIEKAVMRALAKAKNKKERTAFA